MNFLKNRIIAHISLVAFLNLILLPYHPVLASDPQEMRTLTKPQYSWVDIIPGGREISGVLDGCKNLKKDFSKNYAESSWSDTILDLTKKTGQRVWDHKLDAVKLVTLGAIAGPEVFEMQQLAGVIGHSVLQGIQTSQQLTNAWRQTSEPKKKVQLSTEKINNLQKAVGQSGTTSQIESYIRQIFSVNTQAAARLFKVLAGFGVFACTDALIADNIDNDLSYTPNTLWCFNASNAISVSDIAANATLVIELLPHLPGTSIVAPPANTSVTITIPNSFTVRFTGPADALNTTMLNTCLDFTQNPTFTGAWTLEVHVDTLTGNIRFTQLPVPTPSLPASPSDSDPMTTQQTVPTPSLNAPGSSGTDTDLGTPETNEVNQEVIGGYVGTAVGVIALVAASIAGKVFKDRHSRSDQQYELANHLRDEGNWNFHNFNSGDGERFAEAIVTLQNQLDHQGSTNYNSLEDQPKLILVREIDAILQEELHRQEQTGFNRGQKRNILYGNKNVLDLERLEAEINDKSLANKIFAGRNLNFTLN